MAGHGAVMRDAITPEFPPGSVLWSKLLLDVFPFFDDFVAKARSFGLKQPRRFCHPAQQSLRYS